MGLIRIALGILSAVVGSLFLVLATQQASMITAGFLYTLFFAFIAGSAYLLPRM